MAFEKFNRRSAARTKEPTITLQRRGTISMNSQTVEMLVGDRAEGAKKIYVDLLYDPDERVIGLKLARKDDPNPHLLRRQGQSGVFIVSATMFVKHYDIETEIARRYRAKQYGDGIVGFGLDDAHSTVGRSKTPSKKLQTPEEAGVIAGV